ncbi:MAG TPA: hypothetical protein VNV87_10430 [Acidimicrobiales bacterium]|nr:hypothetical protein [Acidimicrobiales bacterium]
MDEDRERGELDESVDEDDRPAAVYPSGSPDAWLAGVAPGGFGLSPLMREPRGSTPLESDHGDERIPTSALWAMKYLGHGRFGLSHDDALDQIRWASGPHGPDDPGAEIYVIDDGYDHCMVSRLVGVSPDGCTYCLVARVKRLDFEDVRAGRAQALDLFSRGKEFTVCGVVEGSISNVIRVAGYRRYREVPADYLPPTTLIEFDGPL